MSRLSDAMPLAHSPTSGQIANSWEAESSLFRAAKSGFLGDLCGGLNERENYSFEAELARASTQIGEHRPTTNPVLTLPKRRRLFPATVKSDGLLLASRSARLRTRQPRLPRWESTALGLKEVRILLEMQT